MIRNSKRLTSSLVLLVLCISLILPTLSSCGILEHFIPSIIPTPEQIGTKDEIIQSIDAAEADGAARYNTVDKYLRSFGMPSYDRAKFEYMEYCFNQLFNLEGGLPDVLTHATETANLFLEYYYDTIDHSDKTIVTDCLLYCYVAAIGDPYSVYRPPVEADEFTTEMSGKFGGIGVMVEYNHNEETIMVNTVYPESPAEAAGLKVGDFIYAVNGITVEEIGYLNAVYHIRGEIGTEVEITVIRGAEFVTVTATRAEVEEINVDYEFDEETKLAHITIVSFKGNTYDQFKEAVDDVMAKGALGIVLDLRNNTGGYVQSACDMLSYILPTGHDLVSYQYKGKNKVVVKSFDEEDGHDHVVDLPFTILCNEYSASSSEIFISALRDHRDAGLIDATIVGTNTFGKGIMQGTYGYTDDSTVTITVSYLYPPCGISYHGTGILPEVTVELGEDSDNQLEVAYSELLKLISNK